MNHRPVDLVTCLLGPLPGLRELDLLTPDQPLRPYPPVHRWRYNGLIRVVIFALLLVVIALVAGLAVALLLGWALGDQARIAGIAQRWQTALGIPVTLGAYLLLVCWVEQRRPPFEMAPRRLLGEVGRGLALGAALQLGCVGALALLGAYRVHGVDWSYNPVWMLVMAGFGAAIMEEVLFRGILYRIVEGTLGSWAAVGISALVFGLSHVPNPQGTWQGGIAIALEAGLLFAVLYALTRSLWLVMGVHFAWNMVQGPVLGIVVSGQSGQGSGYLKSTLTGPQWLSGGPFGMEASMVTVALLAALAVWLLVQLHRRQLVVAPFWVRRRLLTARQLVAEPSAAQPWGTAAAADADPDGGPEPGQSDPATPQA